MNSYLCPSLSPPPSLSVSLSWLLVICALKHELGELSIHQLILSSPPSLTLSSPYLGTLGSISPSPRTLAGRGSLVGVART